MAFKVIERNARIEGMAVSIGPSGSMRFNRAATDELVKMKAASLLLLWDEDELKFALAPSEDSDARAFKISFAPTGHHSSLATKGFSRLIGWSATKAIQIPLSFGKTMSGRALIGKMPPEHLKKKS